MDGRTVALIQRGHDALLAALGTPDGEESVDQFVQHHLDELEPAWWQAHLGTGVPDARSMLGLLEHTMLIDDGNGLQIDFGLPDEVSDYRLTVHFNRDGAVTAIMLED